MTQFESWAVEINRDWSKEIGYGYHAVAVGASVQVLYNGEQVAEINSRCIVSGIDADAVRELENMVNR